MAKQDLRPKLIVIAGPNGSGKTTFTNQVLRHEWSAGCFFINPDEIAKNDSPEINAARVLRRVMAGGHDVPITKIISRYDRSIANSAMAMAIVDRAYAYDNSIDDQDPKKLFRIKNGIISKTYRDLALHNWAQMMLEELSPPLSKPK
jgi:predicted ABC-type ATPase